MIDLLSKNPVLLLFLVAAAGYLIGTIKIGSNRLGVAAILFVGLAVGAFDSRLIIPEIVFLMGLTIYVYSIGLSSGPVFFKSYKQNGFRDIGFIISMLMLSGVVAVGVAYLFHFTAGTITGIYTGSTTNTPAMAGVIDYINGHDSSAGLTNIEDLVVGYSFSYPMGVLGGMIAIALCEKWLKIDYRKEQEKLKQDYPVGDDLTSKTIIIRSSKVENRTLRDLFKDYNWNVVFGRLEKQGKITLVNWDTSFNQGDRVMIAGSEADILSASRVLGDIDDDKLSHDRSEYDVRRIFVSNPMVAGHTLSSLNLHEKYNCIISRIRRGDMEMLAKGDTILELGDRIRFVARREDLRELSKFFGDSYRESARVNLFSFGLGIGLGLLLGNIELSLPGAISFKLGYAGGPLIIGLILGSLRRTGAIVWSLPYSANVTLQQLGLILVLATIGVRSGQSFIQSVSLEGMWIFLASAIISLTTAFATLIIGYKIIKIPFSLLMGMVSNQPAILDFALSKTGNRLPTFGYTMMFPIGLIAKIVIAQILYLVLS